MKADGSREESLSSSLSERSARPHMAMKTLDASQSWPG